MQCSKLQYEVESIGSKLGTIRIDVFKTQQNDLAEVMCMSQSNLSSIENGRVMPTLEVILLYCLTCQVSIDTFLVQEKFNKFVNQAPANLAKYWASIMDEKKEDVKMKLHLLAGHIKYTREQIKMITQKRFAEILGVSQSNISDIEKGKVIPSMQTLVDITNALEVDINDLVSTVSNESDEACLLKDWETLLFKTETHAEWKQSGQINVTGLTDSECIIIKRVVEELRKARNTPDDAAEMIVIQPENNDKENRVYGLKVLNRAW